MAKISGLTIVAMLLTAAIAGAQSSDSRIEVLNIHALPLGDGKISSTPRRGYVMSCMTSFRGGGARGSGPWIHGDTWDLTQKPHVQGKVMWPQAQFEITTDDGSRVVSRIIRGNGLPVDTPTGTFPIARTDSAFQFDGNPNSIREQNIMVTLPMNPQLAETPSCVPMGMIGVALNGVAIYNALDAAGRDAVAHEVQDLCNGHPQMQGQYHYHGPSACLPGETANETLIGYALDGFGIYSEYDAQGRELTNADLDECHGRTSEVEWNGSRQKVYHYVLTREYPYTIGCFRGTPVRTRRPIGEQQMGEQPMRPGSFPFRPPPGGGPSGRPPFVGPPPFGGPPPPFGRNPGYPPPQ